MILSSAIMFHSFHSDNHVVTPGSISQDDFRSMLETVAKHRSIVGPEEFWERVSRDDYNVASSDFCILTFDDALKSQFDLAAPVLEDLGITAIFNVYTGVFDDQKPTLEIFAQFRSQYFDSFGRFFKVFQENLALIGRNPAQILSEYPGDYLQLFPFYSTEERQFRYMRDQVLTKIEYETVMLEMIRKKDTNATEIANSLWMTEADLSELVGGAPAWTPQPHSPNADFQAEP